MIHHHSQGAPQSSVVSPFLFNVLMEGLMDANFGQGVKLLRYADALALVFQRWNCNEQTPLAFACLGEKNLSDYGLKFHINKTRVMVCGRQQPERAAALSRWQSARLYNHPPIPERMAG